MLFWLKIALGSKENHGEVSSEIFCFVFNPNVSYGQFIYFYHLPNHVNLQCKGKSQSQNCKGTHYSEWPSLPSNKWNFLQKSLQLQQNGEVHVYVPFYFPLRTKLIPAEKYSCHCSNPVLSQAFEVANWGFPDTVSGLKQTAQHSDVDFNQTHVCGSVKPLGFRPWLKQL